MPPIDAGRVGVAWECTHCEIRTLSASLQIGRAILARGSPANEGCVPPHGHCNAGIFAGRSIFLCAEMRGINHAQCTRAGGGYPVTDGVHGAGASGQGSRTVRTVARAKARSSPCGRTEQDRVPCSRRVARMHVPQRQHNIPREAGRSVRVKHGPVCHAGDRGWTAKWLATRFQDVPNIQLSGSWTRGKPSLLRTSFSFIKRSRYFCNIFILLVRNFRNGLRYIHVARKPCFRFK